MRLFLNYESAVGQRTGIGNYTHELFNKLRHFDSIASIDRFVWGGFLAANNDSSEPTQVTSASQFIQNTKRLIRRLPFAYPARQLMRTRSFRKALERRLALYSGDECIYHEPNFILLPFDGTKVTTIHDISWVRFPDFHPAERVRWLENNIQRTLAEASRIITVSEFVKRELVVEFSVAPHRIDVVYNGVSELFVPTAKDDCIPILRRRGLEHGSFFLTVCTFEPRKNLVRLLQAFSKLTKKERLSCPLVHVGAVGWCSDEIQRAADRLQREGSFIRIGYVHESELPSLYSGCRAFLFPSLYEGFGLPVLEAMSCGAPVITSKHSAMSEIAGEYACYVEPNDQESIYRSIREHLDLNSRDDSNLWLGVQHAAQFSWMQTAKLTFDSYKRAVNNPYGLAT